MTASSPSGVRRGVTPGLPTNSGSFKAAEKAESGVALTADLHPLGATVPGSLRSAWANSAALHARSEGRGPGTGSIIGRATQAQEEVYLLSRPLDEPVDATEVDHLAFRLHAVREAAAAGEDLPGGRAAEIADFFERNARAKVRDFPKAMADERSFAFGYVNAAARAVARYRDPSLAPYSDDLTGAARDLIDRWEAADSRGTVADQAEEVSGLLLGIDEPAWRDHDETRWNDYRLIAQYEGFAAVAPDGSVVGQRHYNPEHPEQRARAAASLAHLVTQHAAGTPGDPRDWSTLRAATPKWARDAGHVAVLAGDLRVEDRLAGDGERITRILVEGDSSAFVELTDERGKKRAVTLTGAQYVAPPAGAEH